jgi:hypothetical protein
MDFMKLYLCCSAIALCAASSPAWGQDAPPPVAPPPATVEGARTFTPEDFARFKPLTALDMLKQVPGFSIREASQERGLGQATGNVLINGQRISGKSNDVITELSRVSAKNVTRIDIVDGATLDVPGLSGQVANIIAKASDISGQFAWRPEFRALYVDPVFTRGEVSVSGKRGPLDYTVGLQNSGGGGGAGGDTYIYNADSTFREFRHDVFTVKFHNPKLSGRFTYDGPGSSVANLNLSYQRIYSKFRELGNRSGSGRTDLIERVRRVNNSEKGYNYEIGGDVEFGLGIGRLKLIGLNGLRHTPTSQTVVTSFASNSSDTGSRFVGVGDQKERIGRAEYRWKGGGADWQLSGEAAFNSLDKVSQLFALRSNGEFQEVPLPGGSATVKEDRYELMASYGRPLSPKLSIQLAAGGEYSNLRQVGGGGLERTFWRPKGLVSAAWKPVPRLDVNFKLQRRVGQLNFGDFLASVNLNDDRQNAGNPDLVPQQSWDAEIETVRNLGRYGTTSLRVYGRLIDDIVDIIPIGLTGESPGNIDRATVFGIDWKGTLQADPMGWRGAKIDMRVIAQRTRVKDPLTGESRPISNNLLHGMSFALRHDVPNTSWAWGASFSYNFYALNYRLTELSRFWEGPVFGQAFVEHKNVLGLTARATLTNFLDGTSMADRTVYVGRRTGPVDFFERRDRKIGPILTLALSGKF